MNFVQCVEWSETTKQRSGTHKAWHQHCYQCKRNCVSGTNCIVYNCILSTVCEVPLYNCILSTVCEVPLYSCILSTVCEVPYGCVVQQGAQLGSLEYHILWESSDALIGYFVKWTLVGYKPEHNMLPLSMRNLNLSWEVVTVQDLWDHSRAVGHTRSSTDHSLWPETLAVKGFRLPSRSSFCQHDVATWKQTTKSRWLNKWGRTSYEVWGPTCEEQLVDMQMRNHISPPSWPNIATCQCVHVNITHLQTFDLSNEYLNVSTFVLALTRLWLQSAHLEAILVPLCKRRT